MEFSRKFEKQGPLYVPTYQRKNESLERYERYRRRWIERVVAAIAFVGGGTNHSAASNTLSISYAPTAGNTLVVVGSTAAASTVTGVTDNATGGTAVYSKQIALSNGKDVEIWATAVGGVKSGTTIVTMTFSTSSACSFCLAEYSGIQRFGNTASATQSGTAYTVSITTQDANNVAVGGFGAANAGYTAATSTIRESTATGVANNAALVETAAATAGATTVNVTSLTLVAGAGVALELRSTAATSGNRNQLMMVGAGT